MLLCDPAGPSRHSPSCDILPRSNCHFACPPVKSLMASNSLPYYIWIDKNRNQYAVVYQSNHDLRNAVVPGVHLPHTGPDHGNRYSRFPLVCFRPASCSPCAAPVARVIERVGRSRRHARGGMPIPAVNVGVALRLCAELSTHETRVPRFRTVQRRQTIL